MQAPKEIIQNKYLRILTTSYNSSLDLLHTAATLLLLGMKMEIIYIHSLIIQVCSLLFENFV